MRNLDVNKGKAPEENKRVRDRMQKYNKESLSLRKSSSKARNIEK